MKQFKKIWADPVWSKVISAIIIAIGAVIWSAISSKISNTDFQTAWITFWNSKIVLWQLTAGAIIVLSVYGIWKHFRATTFQYDDETIKLDQAIFQKIRTELLPQTGSIYFLRHNNFAGFSFKIESIHDLDKFELECKKSDFEFINPSLEQIKNELLEAVSDFTFQIGRHTFSTPNGRQTVPPEWELEQPDRFNTVVNDLHTTKFKICEKYDELIRLGRRVLKV
jgi:hypothetical protein